MYSTFPHNIDFVLSIFDLYNQK